MTWKQKGVWFGLIGILLLLALRVLEYFVSPEVIWPISSIVAVCVLAYMIRIWWSKEKWK
jgi:membrane protein YdbS with pleckstrin-like domain